MYINYFCQADNHRWCLLLESHLQCYFVVQLQNDVDDSEVDALSNEEENQEEKEPKKISTISLVIVLIVLLVCVTAFAGAVWWTYGNGSQCPSILRGYEPVAGSDANTLTDEFSTSTHVP